MTSRTLLFVTALACASRAHPEDLTFPSTPATPPQEAAKAFHVLEGFELQLIAAEPLVTDPVAITYDADGRAYACEMNDYPYTDKEHHQHSQVNPTDQAIGRVRLLVDTDGDGVFDKATVFAEGLSWPTGCACWKGGIFVTATPDIWYLKDTDGDGVADVRQKAFTGFTKLNVQAVMNNPIWGLDHRIYVAGGSNGGTIERVPGSEQVMPLPKDFKPIAFKRNDFSFDPSTGDVRLESGGARFGNTFDDWGNRFLCNIRNPCQHVVLPYRYLARNPNLVVPSALNDCAEAGDQLPVYRTSPEEPWRVFRAKRWVSEGSTLPKSELQGSGVVTSSSGITIYRGDAYPPEYRDFAFVADVAGNLFYRLKLEPDGVTFKAKQVDGQKNFCTSDDLWFRPVNFVNAPDGCLHVCDMYREVIEHPWSIPDDIHAALDLLKGRDKGRLWRLAPHGFKPRAAPKLSTAPTKELVALLDHPNAWHRETAMRLLFERQDGSARASLVELVRSASTSQGKVNALWAAGSLHDTPLQLIQETIAAIAYDDNEFVRASAVQHATEWQDHAPLDRAGISKRLRESDAFRQHAPLKVPLPMNITSARVAFWMALYDGNADSKESLDHLVTLQWYYANDPSLRAALLSYRDSPLVNIRLLGGLQGKLVASKQTTNAMLPEIARRLGLVLTKNDREVVDAILEPPLPAPLQRELVEGLVRGMISHGVSVAELDALPALSGRVAKWRDEALQALKRKELPAATQALATLAVFAPLDAVAPEIPALFEPSQPAELQLAALEALGSYREPAVADILLDAWPKLTPALKDKAIALILTRTDRIAKLLDAFEAKKMLPGQLSAAARATLLRQKNEPLASRIAKLLGGTNSNRAEVIAKYQSALSLAGDPVRGAKVYETTCMVCHKHGDQGNDIGPHLGTIKGWTAEQILTNVLDPNREVSPNFALYLVETTDGRTLSGLISSESAGNLTLKQADGSQVPVLRSEVKSLTSPGASLMPEGLEAGITADQMADLIAFLRK